MEQQNNVRKINGRKKAKKLTRNQLENDVTIAVNGLQQQSQMIQAIIKQMMVKQNNLDRDIGNAIGLLNDLQYRTLAMIEASSKLGIKKEDIETVASTLKLIDYNKASDAEDDKVGLIVSDEVTKDSTVIISSTVNGNKNVGIFRSKFKMGTSGQKEVEELLIGLKVGETVAAKINDVEHVIKIEGIRENKPEEKQVPIV